MYLDQVSPIVSQSLGKICQNDDGIDKNMETFPLSPPSIYESFKKIPASASESRSAPECIGLYSGSRPTLSPSFAKIK